MKTFLLTVSTPDGTVFSEEIGSIMLRNTEGDLAVLAGHTPMVTAVVPCDCILTLADEQTKSAHITGGVLSVEKEELPEYLKKYVQ